MIIEVSHDVERSEIIRVLRIFRSRLLLVSAVVDKRSLFFLFVTTLKRSSVVVCKASAIRAVRITKSLCLFVVAKSLTFFFSLWNFNIEAISI